MCVHNILWYITLLHLYQIECKSEFDSTIVNEPLIRFIEENVKTTNLECHSNNLISEACWWDLYVQPRQQLWSVSLPVVFVARQRERCCDGIPFSVWSAPWVIEKLVCILEKLHGCTDKKSDRVGTQVQIFVFYFEGFFCRRRAARMMYYLITALHFFMVRSLSG